MTTISEKSTSVSIHDTDKVYTFIEYFYHWENTKPDAVYLKQPDGGSWTDYTWKEVGSQARRIAAMIKEMNLPAQSRIALFSKNCAHWVICDIAIKMSGHVSVPFYPNLTSDQLSQLLEHSESKLLFVGKLDSMDAVEEGVPEGIRVVSFPICPGDKYEKWDDILQKYDPITDNPIPNMDDLESIVYTSGTTGVPKGVMKTYYTNAVGIKPTLKITHLDKIEGRFLSYLPLNHDAERAIVEGGSLINGGTIYFVESLDTFIDNLKEARPTIFFGVPRIWTKFQMGVLEKIDQKKLNLLFKIPIVSGLIKRSIRKNLGLNDLEMAFSGAAPISASTLDWFEKLGVSICEGYGMTENNAICTINPKNDTRIGTVGIPYPGCELKIDPETSEILAKAEWSMKGYYKNQELTDQVIKDGWLHTGDMGEIEDGYLKITGRVKDMFKTSKGEYIIPVPMERMFASNTLIEQVCVVGYGLPQPFALINLSDAAYHMEKGEVEERLKDTLEAVNNSVADYERINRVVITEDTWTVENGLMTPTLKVRRNVMDARYKVRMEEWYNEGEHLIIWE